MSKSKAPDRPRAPKGLAARGRRFWAVTTEAYTLTDAELELLLEVCRTLDTLDRLADVVVEHGATLEGSKGQRVVNGAMTEARGQRLALHRLLAALGLPDEDGAAVPSPRTMQAERAGAARWAGVKTEASLRRGSAS